MKKNLLGAAFLLLYATAAFGQSNYNWSSWPTAVDTVQGRMLISSLPDSTLIEYEITQLRIRSGAFNHFIDFDSATDTFPGFYKTETFLSHSNHDTLSFMCFASFSAGAPPSADSMDNMDTAQVDSVFNSWKNVMVGSFVTPDPRYFDDTSFIFYVLELQNARNDSVLMALDTIRCFVHPETGHLFYSAMNDRPDFVRIPLPADSGINLYVKVKRTTILPVGSSLTDQSLVFNNQRGLREDTAYEGYQRKYPMTSSPKITSSVPYSSHGVSISALSPNPAGSMTTLFVGTPAPTGCNITISDNIGRRVFMEHVVLHAGRNRVKLSISSLPSGNYVVTIPLGNEVFYSHLTKIQTGDTK